MWTRLFKKKKAVETFEAILQELPIVLGGFMILLTAKTIIKLYCEQLLKTI